MYSRQESDLMLTRDNIDRVIDQMEKLSILRKMEKGVDAAAKYKARVDDEAVETLKSITLPMSVDNLSQYKYIGVESGGRPSIITRVREILTSANHTTSDYANASAETRDRIDVYSELLKIPHIGIVYAGKLYDSGIRTIDDLKVHGQQLYQQGIITAAQYKGIELLSSTNGPLEGKFHRSEGDAYSGQLVSILQNFNGQYGTDISFMITGSYRRGNEYIGDIDVLICDNQGKLTHEIQQEIVYQLQEYGLLVNLMSKGYKKVSGYCDTSRFIAGGGMRRVDLEFVYDNWNLAAELLYFTGDLNFNTAMRLRAKNMGYHLTNDGLYHVNLNGAPLGDKIQVSSEEDIFKILEIVYLEPNQRVMEKSS